MTHDSSSLRVGSSVPVRSLLLLVMSVTSSVLTETEALSSSVDAYDRPPPAHHKHLVLVGGGHAHAQVVRALNTASRPADLSVTLIDRNDEATYSGMVPGCVAGEYDPKETRIALRPLAAWAGVRFLRGAVVDADLDARVLKVRRPDASIASVSYDRVSLDVGSATRGADAVEGAREFAVPTRPIDALVERLREVERRRGTTAEARVLVVGGGAAGVELALAARARWNPRSVTLLHAGPSLLPGESDECREALLRSLEERGVDVRSDRRAESLGEREARIARGADGVVETLPFDVCVWATGATPHAALTNALRRRGLATDGVGWIRVGPTLRSESHPDVFAAGDCAAVRLANGRPSPPKAGVYAVRASPVLITNLVRSLYAPDEPLVEYEPQDDFLRLINLGDGEALGLRFGVAMRGRWVWRLKDRIDRMFMELFDEKTLPDMSDEQKKKELDTSQYDAETVPRPPPLEPDVAARLLRRTDDEVDHDHAWNVLRDMVDDPVYRSDVLREMRTRRMAMTTAAVSA